MKVRGELTNYTTSPPHSDLAYSHSRKEKPDSEIYQYEEKTPYAITQEI
jgi:hypothetical protein